MTLHRCYRLNVNILTNRELNIDTRLKVIHVRMKAIVEKRAR